MKMFIVGSRRATMWPRASYHVFGDTIELVYNGSDERCPADMRPNHAPLLGA